MKQKRQLFIKLSVLFFLLISLGSCSSSDEPGPEISKDTFFKKFHGTKWEYVQDWGRTDIFRFNDDELNPFVIWYKEEDANCYYFFKSHEMYFEILENTPDKFVIYMEHIIGNKVLYYNWSFVINEKDNISLNGHNLTEVDKTLVICPD